MAIAIAVLVFSAFLLGNVTPALAGIGKPTEQTSFTRGKPFTRCNDLCDAGETAWDGNRMASRNGIHYARAAKSQTQSS